MRTVFDVIPQQEQQQQQQQKTHTYKIYNEHIQKLTILAISSAYGSKYTASDVLTMSSSCAQMT